MTYYTVTPARGGFVAAWPTRGDVYFARLDGQGHSVRPGETKTPGRAGMRTSVLTLSASDGTTLVAWKDGGRLGWQLYGEGGQPLGQPGSVESPGNGATGVTGKDGRFTLFR